MAHPITSLQSWRALATTEVVGNTPEQFVYQQAEYDRWKKVIETGKITAD
ncbi:hypothetical protein [Variovorax sp. DT-64]